MIKVRAASVNPLDYHLLRHPFIRRILSALSKVKITRPGRDVAGQVEAIGRNVTQFKPGDAVFGWSGGAFAEYACTSQSALVMKPDNVTFEQAASVPVAGLTALQGLRDKGQIQPGQKVLINGAAGGVGTFAVQIAKSFGADVTAVCSARNVDMVRSIGADRVIDYTREDFTKSGQHYNLIFDLVANHSFSARRRVLNPKGIYIGAGIVGLGGSMIGLLTRRITELVLSRFVSQKFVTFMAKLSKEDLTIMRELMDPVKGVAFSFWAALSALSGLGIRYPLKMLPLLLLQLLYKSIWLLAVYLPLRSAGRSTDLTKVMVIGVVVDLIVIRWPYVLTTYVKQRGDRWR